MTLVERPKEAHRPCPTGSCRSAEREARRLRRRDRSPDPAYLGAVAEVASGGSPDIAIPVLLLATGQLLLAGSRLGAIQDVVLVDRPEADPGPDADVECCATTSPTSSRSSTHYADVSGRPGHRRRAYQGMLSNDIHRDPPWRSPTGCGIADVGRRVEALWWWQFSYLSTWGERAAASLRVLQSILAHLRLDADDEVVADAEFEALHP
ncbi:MAG: DUF5063 domain-containing protein [Actinomycetales bacterium]|nr:DUF5063 domain-containing protein [Actinomycetales bacterium]